MEDLKDGMCRCCASEGTFKDFTASYQWMGAEEVYGDMLKDCFDITLSTSLVNNGGICEVCITQLRNAFNFKKQVQNTEEHFKKIQEKILKEDIVKIELNQDPMENSDGGDNIDDDFSSPEYDVPIQSIKLEKIESKTKKRPARASASKAKKAKAEVGETSNKREQGSVKTNALGGTRNRELQKHLDNIELILKWSNATPIKSYGGKGYMCSYCRKQFLIPADLKKHTKLRHSKIVASIVDKFDSTTFHVKLDITDLQCVCKKLLDDVDGLIDHLIREHKLYFHTDITNYIIPIKFDNDELRCYICINRFCSFKTLVKHMNVHLRNFICNVCDEGFVYSKQLKNHAETHKTGCFKCDSCEKSFDTKQKRRYHVRNVHAVKARNKCGYCGDYFMDYRTKISHQHKVHGISCVINCNSCERSFITQRGYHTHMQRDHLMIRRHPCKHCDMRFYTTSELKCHLAKHNVDVPVFKCDICMKSYKRKSTLRDHLRIHADDRQYRCEVCGRSFVHRCSWRSHLSSKHGIIQPKLLSYVR